MVHASAIGRWLQALTHPQWLAFTVPPLKFFAVKSQRILARTAGRHSTTGRAGEPAVPRNDPASQQMDSLGHLTGGIAHEFNNLLTVVLGNATALRVGAEARSDPQAIRRAEMIERAAERGARLAGQLLAFSGKLVLMPRVVSPYDVVSDSYRTLAEVVDETTRIVLTSEPRLWNGLVDPAPLESAVLNLVLNARDAMPGGGNITIRFRNRHIVADALNAPWRRSGSFVSIDVQDTGCGIPPELHQKVFEPFFTTKPVGQGSGLGLAQVHGFARQSGGWVEIDSAVGRGTTVSLFLPRARRTDRPPGIEAGTDPATGTLQTTLIVEPDPQVRAALSEALAEAGYVTLEASTASGAITHFVSPAPIHAAVIAERLPGGLSGTDLGRHGQQLRPDLCVLVTSERPRDHVASAQDKRLDFLIKPFAAKDLVPVVAALLKADTFSVATEEMLAEARHNAGAETTPALRINGGGTYGRSQRTTIRLGVRPFIAMGAHDRAFCVGLAEEITAAFAGFRMITCIAPASLTAVAAEPRNQTERWRQLDLDYLVEGTLRKRGDDVRVRVRLLKMSGSGEIAWAQRFGSKLSDVLNLQDQIAHEIAGQVAPQVVVWEGREAAARPQVDATAYDLMMRSIPAIYSLDRAGFNEAGLLLEQSLGLDPSSAGCHSWLAHWYLLRLGQGWEPDPRQAVSRAESLAQKAITLDPDDARGYTVAGHVQAFLRRDATGALALHERALALNPSVALAWCYSGLAHTYLGNHAEAIRSIQHAQQLSPHDPHSFFFDAALMVPFLMTCDYEMAARLGRRARDAHPGVSSTYKSLIPALVLLGAHEEAASARRTLMELEPKFCVASAIARSPLLRDDDLNLYIDGLRRAGIPERYGMPDG